MFAEEFWKQIHSFNVISYVGFEDMADRANFQWMISLYVLSAVLVGAKQYFMTSINCYIATSVSGFNSDGYMNNMCWTEGLYPMDFQNIPFEDESWVKRSYMKMTYYQWVTIMLGVQALLYYLPSMLWKLFCNFKLGVDLNNIVKLASDAAKMDDDAQKQTLASVVTHLDAMLYSRREFRVSRINKHPRMFAVLSRLPVKRSGHTLFFVYLVYKLMYVCVGLGQLWLMYAFLDMRQHHDKLGPHTSMFSYGISLLRLLAGGHTWHHSQIFPRIGMCRHELVVVGGTNKMFGQCVLPINMLNEKVYIMLSLATLLVLCLTVVSVFTWLFRVLSARRSRHFIKRFFKMSGGRPTTPSDMEATTATIEMTTKNDNGQGNAEAHTAHCDDDAAQRALLDKFLAMYLRHDGKLIVRMLAINSGDLVATRIVEQLFALFKRRHDEWMERQEGGGCGGDPAQNGEAAPGDKTGDGVKTALRTFDMSGKSLRRKAAPAVNPPQPGFIMLPLGQSQKAMTGQPTIGPEVPVNPNSAASAVEPAENAGEDPNHAYARV